MDQTCQTPNFASLLIPTCRAALCHQLFTTFKGNLVPNQNKNKHRLRMPLRP